MFHNLIFNWNVLLSDFFFVFPCRIDYRTRTKSFMVWYFPVWVMHCSIITIFHMEWLLLPLLKFFTYLHLVSSHWNYGLVCCCMRPVQQVNIIRFRFLLKFFLVFLVVNDKWISSIFTFAAVLVLWKNLESIILIGLPIYTVLLVTMCWRSIALLYAHKVNLNAKFLFFLLPTHNHKWVFNSFYLCRNLQSCLCWKLYVQSLVRCSLYRTQW